MRCLLPTWAGPSAEWCDSVETGLLNVTSTLLLALLLIVAWDAFKDQH